MEWLKIKNLKSLPHPTLAPAFPVVLLSSCPPEHWSLLLVKIQRESPNNFDQKRNGIDN